MTRTMIVLPCPGSSGVEQWIENPRVGGSIPPPGTIFQPGKNHHTLVYINKIINSLDVRA